MSVNGKMRPVGSVPEWGKGLENDGGVNSSVIYLI
jgi:hypothetical protein